MDDTISSDDERERISFRDKIRNLRPPERLRTKPEPRRDSSLVAIDAILELLEKVESLQTQLVTVQAELTMVKSKSQMNEYETNRINEDVKKVKRELDEQSYKVSPSDSLREMLKF